MKSGYAAPRLGYGGRTWLPDLSRTLGGGMIFSIYTRPDGAYLLVPECMQPSVVAERLHGPLKFLELMDWCEEPLPDIWKTVMAELDGHSFVVIQDAAAKCLSETESSFSLYMRRKRQ